MCVPRSFKKKISGIGFLLYIKKITTTVFFIRFYGEAMNLIEMIDPKPWKTNVRGSYEKNLRKSRTISTVNCRYSTIIMDRYFLKDTICLNFADLLALIQFFSNIILKKVLEQP